MHHAELVKLLLQEKERRLAEERERLTAEYWRGIYHELSDEFKRLAQAHGLLESEAICRVVPEKYGIRAPESSPASMAESFLEMLSTERALRTGRGLIVRCNLKEHYGDSSAGEPRGFRGKVAEAGGMISGKEAEKAIFFSVLNALYNFAGGVQKTVHCRWEQMEACGQDLVAHLRKTFGKKITVAHIGYKPEHVKPCSKAFKTYVTDMQPKHVGKVLSGVKVLDESKNEEVIKKADVACIPGCTAVNGTLPGLLRLCEKYRTVVLLYGVTVAACTKILKLEHFCPYARRSP
jgi:hypothetical protein